MGNVTPTNEEYSFEDLIIITQTDETGKITYANKAFTQVSGYTQEELMGEPHSIVRHPDMPKTLFEKMWHTIQNGQVWNGVIKNLRKDGKFYWVDAEILPIKDNNDNITGYISAQRAATHKDIEDNEELYNKMLAAETK